MKSPIRLGGFELTSPIAGIWVKCGWVIRWTTLPVAVKVITGTRVQNRYFHECS